MREGEREEAIVMQMSQPSVLFVAGNLISSCGATIQSRWNVKNAPTRSGLGQTGGLNAEGEALVSNTFQSQTSLSLLLRHLTAKSPVSFSFFPPKKIAFTYQLIKWTG